MNPGGNLGIDIIDHVGALPIAFYTFSGFFTYAFGYPAAPSQYNGERLIYCFGVTFADYSKNPTALGVDCDTRGGASGGPWLANFDGQIGTVVSVNSYFYNDDPVHLFAPYQGGAARSLHYRVRNA